MKAVVFHNIQDIRYEPNWREPRRLKTGEVKIATSWCGICGTDMEDYKQGAVIPVDKPHPVSGAIAPLVIGHEYSGVVAELGPGVTTLKVGQRVAMECLRVCHNCHWCNIGEYASCINQVSIGQMDDGGMAEYFNIPAEDCIPISENLRDDHAALVEPFAVMIRAVQKGRVKAGDVVTVVGAGAIGLCGLAAARAAGASKVISINHGGHRAEVAQQVGATHNINTRDEHWREEFLDITQGMGSEVVIDAGANLDAVKLAFELTARRGRCVINSVINHDAGFNVLDIVLNEKEIIGTCAHWTTKEIAWGLQYMTDGRANLDPIITSRIYIADAVGEGFDKLLADRSQIKVLVTPHKDWVK
jgi:(R,R)-butanediol dehydrogenase / meso-butanediol dehydrogenase / diacetyl reductase